MKRFLILLLSLLLSLCVFSSCAETYPAIPEDVAALLDRQFAKYSTLGASVAVFENGKITYVHSYGTAWITGPGITPETGFQCGSISKMVSNIGLMQLLEANGFGLESELGDVLGFPIRHPQYPDTPITLRQVMTHTAALRDSADYNDAIKGKPLTVQELFTDRASFTFLANTEPGLVREYSNFGGGLIGVMIEKLSGQTVNAYMKEHVFDPLDITAGYHAALLRGTIPLADMYTMPERYLAKSLRQDNTVEESPDWTRCYTITAGSLIISAPDLCKILIALCDGGVFEDTRLLSGSAASSILTLQDHIGSVSCETSAGLFLNILVDAEVEGRIMYGHGGKAYGMLCAAYFDPSDRTGVVMLTNGCNNSSVHEGTGMLGRQILTICYHQLIDPNHETEDPFLIDD